MDKLLYKIVGSLSKDKLVFSLCLILAASIHGMLALVSLSNKDKPGKNVGFYYAQTDSSCFVDLVNTQQSPSLTQPSFKNEETKIALPTPPLPSTKPISLSQKGAQAIRKNQAMSYSRKGNAPCLARKEYKEYALSTSFLSPPPYPYEARLRHMEGTVVILLEIRQGKIVASRVVRSSGHLLLDVTAKNWIDSHWKFPPHVSRTLTEAITFELENASPPPSTPDKYYQASYIPS
ncbi:energy transducer TonB [Candidatus Methylacidiphilum infernorum]|uniref:Periplasmic protein TonB n=1 Tax=Methylacidiphilum infernorum (isolate V4) TaxID=481448 RepID=B3DV05_METI4|nr:energy transducer TonB [Candidatus Methylacidiphilum infernorum]ACD83158.1 Periplasmic protein TonB [Methylacidiphilum infernorum V4]